MRHIFALAALPDHPPLCLSSDTACIGSATFELPRCSPFPECIFQAFSRRPPLCGLTDVSCIECIGTAIQGLPACWPFPECAAHRSPGFLPSCSTFDAICINSAARGFPLYTPWPDCVLLATQQPIATGLPPRCEPFHSCILP